MPQHDAATRTAVANMRFIEGLGWTTISDHLPHVKAESARTFCRQLKSKHPNAAPFELVQLAGANKPRGITTRVLPGSNASITIRRKARAEYRGKPPVVAANRAMQTMRGNDARMPLKPLSYNQVNKILTSKEHGMKDPDDSKAVTRHKMLRRPPLEKLDLPARKVHIEKVLKMRDANTLIITCDETPIEYGGDPMRQILAPAGTTHYTDSSKPVFTLMQWAGACADTSVERPIKVWQKETVEETNELLSYLANKQALLKEYVEKQRANALIPGTREFDYLKETNTQVANKNAEERSMGRPGKKQRFTSTRLYKHETLSRDNSKGGLDFLWYAIEAYEKRLFPYYEEIRRRNPNKQVVIMEDNVRLHHKARRLLAPYIEEKNIIFLETPAYSPDLNTIETLHRDEKGLIEDFSFSIVGSSQAVKNMCKAKMKEIWCHNKIFNDYVARRCSLRYVHKIYNRAKRSNPPYGNRYKDS